MPWEKSSVHDQRLLFIAQYLLGEQSMVELCSQFQISRTIGYKWIDRYHQEGLTGLKDRSRAPHTHPNAVLPEVSATLIAVKTAHPSWGPRKIRQYLRRNEPTHNWPATSTIGLLLDQEGLVRHRHRRQRAVASPTSLTTPISPNHVWSIDFKGWFKLGDGTYCYPLTITDNYSRYLIRCQALSSMKLTAVRPVMEMVFRECGLPDCIRSDNGSPFSSHGLGGLTQLSLWWLKLGIRHERIDPGRPDQNGRHERFHLTLNNDLTHTPAAHLRAQQKAFISYQREYNTVRPHDALDGNTPADVFTRSSRSYPTRRLPTFTYEPDVITRRIDCVGKLYYRGHDIFVSEALRGECVGLRELTQYHHVLSVGQLPIAILDITTMKWLPRKEANNIFKLCGEEYHL